MNSFNDDENTFEITFSDLDNTVWEFFEQSGNTVECRLLSGKAGLQQQHGIHAKPPAIETPKQVGETAAAGIGATASGSQASFRDFTYIKPKKCNKVRSEHISNLIAEMVALDMQPGSTVEDDGFF